jgi:DNA-directed RNA polymerase III subunit RPC8
MFLLVQVRDLVRLAPHEFGWNNVDAIKKQLELKLANKVIPDVGLCIIVKQIDHVGDCTVFPGDGGAHCDVLVSIVVFRPYEGEVLYGRVASSSRQGLRLTLDFFHDIVVPPYLMKSDMDFDGTNWVWTWKAEEGEEATKHELQKGDPVHFRVHTIKFTKTSRSGKARARAGWVLVVVCARALSERPMWWWGVCGRRWVVLWVCVMCVNSTSLAARNRGGCRHGDACCFIERGPSSRCRCYCSGCEALTVDSMRFY